MKRLGGGTSQRIGKRPWTTRAVGPALLPLLLLTGCARGAGNEAGPAAAAATAAPRPPDGDADAPPSPLDVAPSEPCPPSGAADRAQLAALDPTETAGHASHMSGAGMLRCNLAEPDREALVAQLELSERAAQAHPRIDDGVADSYVYGQVRTGAEGDDPSPQHYVRWDLVDGEFDPARPEQLLYGPDGDLVALSYFVVGPATTLPTGFAGPQDRWHRHGGLCVDRAHLQILGIDGSLPPDACAAAGGRYGVDDGWMLHVWVVPEHPNEDGIFATDNPAMP